MKPQPILPTVQNYDWGEQGNSALIPRLLGIRPKKNVPYAELWLGAPQLKFLVKILTASKNLSIQAHPNAAQAKAGFAREKNIRDKSLRNYRDPNPKYEMIIALSDFYLLSGFRKLDDIAREWKKSKALLKLSEPPKTSIKAFYGKLMTLDPNLVNLALAEHIRALGPLSRHSKNSAAYWFLKAAHAHCPGTSKDRGLLAFYLLNLIHLKPSEAHFIRAGRLHSHLEGRGIEVMTHSDNVVRGGLTSKHVDLSELLKICSFSPDLPDILKADSDGEFTVPGRPFRVQMTPRKRETAPFLKAERGNWGEILLQICYKKFNQNLKISCYN